jgi:hypothetical protein
LSPSTPIVVEWFCMQALVAASPSGAPEPQVPRRRPAACSSTPSPRTRRIAELEGETS